MPHARFVSAVASSTPKRPARPEGAIRTATAAFAFAVLGVQAEAQYAREPSPPPEVTSWVRANAVNLDTLDAGSGFVDLAPIEPWIGNARVVAIGEATHGSREFFQFKHRMLEFLVERMGFTAFAIEAGYPEARRVDRYVRTGEGEAAGSVIGMGYWTWATEEVEALVEWIRAYNADPAHTRRVRFYGIDMQLTQLACQQVLDYLGGVDPTLLPSAEAALAPFRVDPDDLWNAYWLLPPATRDEHAAQLADLLAVFDSRRDGFVAASDEESWAENRQSLVVVTQAQRFFSVDPGDFFGVYNTRDAAMSENALWALGQEGAEGRVLLWAHNAHVYSGSISSFRPLGARLRAALGTRLLVIGQHFDRGSFMAVEANPALGLGDLKEFTVGSSRQGSLNEALDSAKLPRFLVDVRAAARDPVVGTWWRSWRPERFIGATFSYVSDRHYLYVFPPRYDLLFFQDVTTAARQLPY